MYIHMNKPCNSKLLTDKSDWRQYQHNVGTVKFSFVVLVLLVLEVRNFQPTCNQNICAMYTMNIQCVLPSYYNI